MPKLINLLAYDAVDKILRLIDENRFSSGQKLPSERDLAHRFGINRTTLRGALQKLVDDGILYRYPNSGYYLAEPKIKKSSDSFFLPKYDKLLSGHDINLYPLSEEVIPDYSWIEEEYHEYHKDFYLEKVDDQPISFFSIFKTDAALVEYPTLYSELFSDTLLRVQTIQTKKAPDFVYELLNSEVDDLLFVEEKVLDSDEIIAVARAYSLGKKCMVQVDVKTEKKEN